MSNLTKRSVDGASPPERKPGESDQSYRKRWAWYSDLEVPGFGVKVYGSGRKVYALRYRTQSGRQRMYTLGKHGALTIKEARDHARAKKVEILDGEDPQAKKQREAVEIRTVEKLVTRWIEDYAKSHRKRWKEDKGRLDRHVKPKLGQLSLEDLTRDVLAAWHRSLGKGTQIQANRCLETLRAAWRWADGEGLLPEGILDPTRSIKKFRERSRDRWLRKPEVKRLMEAVAKQSDDYVRAAIPLFLLTGLRKRELLNARWENIDLERGEIRLPETKSGVAQVRLLRPRAVQILTHLPRASESPFVFPSPQDPMKPRDDIKKPWAEIREKAGLPSVTLHDLRRTAGSLMAQAGIPLQVIGKVLGHSHPGVTKLYARLASENERQALDTLSDELEGVLGLTEDSEAEESRSLEESLRAVLESSAGDPKALQAGLRDLGFRSPVEA